MKYKIYSTLSCFILLTSGFVLLLTLAIFQGAQASKREWQKEMPQKMKKLPIPCHSFFFWSTIPCHSNESDFATSTLKSITFTKPSRPHYTVLVKIVLIAKINISSLIVAIASFNHETSMSDWAKFSEPVLHSIIVINQIPVRCFFPKKKLSDKNR